MKNNSETKVRKTEGNEMYILPYVVLQLIFEVSASIL